jgi:hypothetical protein
MNFRQWLQNEINLDMSNTAVKQAVNPQVDQKNSMNVAKGAMNQFGPQIVQQMSSASSPKTGAKVAMSFAQKVQKTGDPKIRNTNADPASVGANIYKMTTGNDLKT